MVRDRQADCWQAGVRIGIGLPGKGSSLPVDLDKCPRLVGTCAVRWQSHFGWNRYQTALNRYQKCHTENAVSPFVSKVGDKGLEPPTSTV